MFTGIGTWATLGAILLTTVLDLLIVAELMNLNILELLKHREL